MGQQAQISVDSPQPPHPPIPTVKSEAWEYGAPTGGFNLDFACLQSAIKYFADDYQKIIEYR
jgi:hypothetical protein